MSCGFFFEKEIKSEQRWMVSFSNDILQDSNTCFKQRQFFLKLIEMLQNPEMEPGMWLRIVFAFFSLEWVSSDLNTHVQMNSVNIFF